MGGLYPRAHIAGIHLKLPVNVYNANTSLFTFRLIYPSLQLSMNIFLYAYRKQETLVACKG